MKKIEFENLEIAEMSSEEMIQVNGGFPWWLVGATAMVIMDNWGDIRDGFTDGTKGTPRYK